MTANKMPEMPEARFWIVIGKYEGRPELGPQSFFYYGNNGRPHVEAHEQQGDKVDALYTADQMRAMYLAGIAAARDEVSGLPNEWRELVRNHYGQGPCGDALLHCAVKLDDTLANLSALEQGVGK